MGDLDEEGLSLDERCETIDFPGRAGSERKAAGRGPGCPLVLLWRNGERHDVSSAG
jgi:hypothetical protein